MKISVDNGVLSTKFGEKEALRLIKEAGFDCVDYAFSPFTKEPFRNESFGDKYKAHAQEMREFLDEIGLSCNQAHAPFGFRVNTNRLSLDDTLYSDIVKSIEMAAILGAENIIVHPITPPEGETVLEYNYNFYKGIEPYAEKFGIGIAIENLFGPTFDAEKGHYVNNRFDRPEQMLEMLDKLNSPHFVACVDTGHATLQGYEPTKYIRGLNNKVLKALHIQDNFYTSDDTHTLPYLGKINWDEVTKALGEIGYDGVFTFELFRFISYFPNELVPAALKLIVETGKHLTNKIERAR